MIPVFKSGMDHVWHAWISKQTMSWPPITPRSYSDVTLHIWTKSLNHRPHQWYSGSALRIMMPGWICHATILSGLFEACTMSGILGSPHIRWHDLQLHHRHAQLLPYTLEGPRVWIMDLVSGVVVQWWWHRYGYAIPLFHECDMMHGPCLTCLYQQRDHGMISNYTPDMISCYPRYLNQELKSSWSSSVI